MFFDVLGGGDVLTHVAIIGGLAVAVILGLLTVVFIVTRFLYICGPNEILVFSGRKHRLPDGSVVGFKVIHGGRAFRMPLLESVSRMDVRLVGVEVAVTNAFSKGGIPLAVHAIANVKVATDPHHVRQAVERFLGMEPAQISAVAQQTLEGRAPRGPEPAHAGGGERRPAEVRRVARAEREGRLRQAGPRARRAQGAARLRRAEVPRRTSGARRSRRCSATRRTPRTTASSASPRSRRRRASAPRVGAAAGRVAGAPEAATASARRSPSSRPRPRRSRTRRRSPPRPRAPTAEQELQRLRAELAKLRLQIETVLPAEAEALANAALRARGEAAPTIENGKATARGARLVVASEWAAAGPAGREVYVLQQLDTIVTAAVQRVSSRSEIGALEIVDGGDGESLERGAGGLPARRLPRARRDRRWPSASTSRRSSEPATSAGTGGEAMIGVALVLGWRRPSSSSSSCPSSSARCSYVSEPNEALVFSGARAAGRGSRDRLPARPRRAEPARAARSRRSSASTSRCSPSTSPSRTRTRKGGIPLNVVGVANVKVAGEEPLVNNAVERFLGRSRSPRSCGSPRRRSRATSAASSRSSRPSRSTRTRPASRRR